jgi:hypothetical protein
MIEEKNYFKKHSFNKWNEWTPDDGKKWNYNWKAKNILISSLGVDE